MVNYTDLIGVPFKNRGRDIKTGVDCYGLAIEVFKRHGYSIPEYYQEYTDYNNTDSTTKIYETHKQESIIWQGVEMNEITVPCLIAMRFGVYRGIVNHVGVYIGNGKFIHIRENTGVVIESINSPLWRRQIVGCYKYVGG